MKLVRIKCVGKVQSLLQFVKTMKTHTGLRLKESKDLCDSIRDKEGQEFTIVVITSPEEFEREILEMVGPSIQVSNRERERHIKLLSLGLGDDIDKIDIIVDELSSKLLMKVKINKQVGLYDIYKDFFFDIVSEFNSEQLENFFNTLIKK